MAFLSTWAIFFLLTLSVALILSCTVIWVIHRYVHADILKRHHELAGYVIGVIGVLYSVFLGFTAANSQDNYEKIISQVNKEAYLCADLIRISARFLENENILLLINDYLHSVVVGL